MIPSFFNNTGDTAVVEDFLRHYPNSSFRAQAESKLEALSWAKASSSGSLKGYQEYAAKYASPAGPTFRLRRRRSRACSGRLFRTQPILSR